MWWFVSVDPTLDRRNSWIQPSDLYGVAHDSTALNVTWSVPYGGGGAGSVVAGGRGGGGGGGGNAPLGNSNSPNIQVATDDDESLIGKLIGYRIRYWPSGKDPQTHSLIKLKRGLDTWGLVVGLQPDTEYHVSVMAYNEAGSGPESESFRLRTFKSAPQRAPTSVSARFLDDTSVRVTWRGVAPLTTNEEPVLGYKVRYWRYDEPINMARDLIKPLGGDDLTLTISDLLSGE